MSFFKQQLRKKQQQLVQQYLESLKKKKENKESVEGKITEEICEKLRNNNTSVSNRGDTIHVRSIWSRKYVVIGLHWDEGYATIGDRKVFFADPEAFDKIEALVNFML